MPGRKVKTQFHRIEAKYTVPSSMAGEIARYIQPYVVEDPHAEGQPDHAYDVLTLYLDSPDLRLYRETREGVLNRLKLRIRRYDRSPSSTAFLEIKRRHNRMVKKDRARLATDAVAQFLGGGAPDTARLSTPERACYDEFTGLTALWLARPVVWVQYRREAWAGVFDPRLRVTFDREICCARADGGIDVPPPSLWKPIEAEGVVLELKLDYAFPEWLLGLVRTFDLTRQSFSKYARSIQAR
jgi:hypothetical protein